MKYKIGDKVWCAICEWTDDYKVCRDCGGTRRIRLIMHDDSVKSIPCGSCYGNTYGVPTGKIRFHHRKPKSILLTLTGVESRDGKVRYYSNNYCPSEDQLFDTEEEANVQAQKYADQQNAEELKKYEEKEKPEKDWAWHVGYYQNQVEYHQSLVEYNQKKLNYAETQL